MAIPQTNITGQSMPKGTATYATHLIAPVVPEAALRDNSHLINDAKVSGKQEGALVICERFNGDLVYAIARGILPTDGWDLATAGSKVTPA